MVKFVDLEAQRKLIPELDASLRKGAGFATRAATAGKSAFVLFCHVNACVQCEVLTIWDLHLSLACLYLIVFINHMHSHVLLSSLSNFINRETRIFQMLLAAYLARVQQPFPSPARQWLILQSVF